MFHKTIRRTPGTAHHVVQRRNNDSPCFAADDDYLFYLDCLTEAAERHRCAIHAYVLMPDQVEFLVSPDTRHGLSSMMRSVGNRYLDYVNYIYQRNGAFWERGFKSALIHGDRNLLACCRSIESTPVRAFLAESPDTYRWSSYNHHAHGCEDAVLRDHLSYVALGATQSERQRAFRQWFDQPSDDRTPAEITYPMDRDFAAGGCRSMDLPERLARRGRLGCGLSPTTTNQLAAAA